MPFLTETTAERHPWYRGLTTDHLYADCPSRMRGESELRRVGWWDDEPAGYDIDPEGGEVCGVCLHRWRRKQAAREQATSEEAADA